MRGHPYAGFWRRLAAYLIDSMVLGTVQLTLIALVATIAPHDLRAQANVVPVGIVLGWAYFSLFECSPMQATIGKLALDICVTDRNGDPIDFRRASIRFLGQAAVELGLHARLADGRIHAREARSA
jgi:uncharacterized RDD family membrane protein YckC